MRIIENVPIFHYGASVNGFTIPEETVRKCIDIFKDVPIFIKEENDLFNKENNVIGVVNEVTNIKEPFVYGDITVFNDEKVEKFFNYDILVIDSHEENEIRIIDKFTLNDVSLY